MVAQKKKRRAGNRGVSMVEAALILPILIATIFFMIDLSRYFYTYVVLNYGAYRGLRVAISGDMTTDLSQCEATDGPCEQYLGRVKNSLNEVLRFARLVAQPSSGNGAVRLVPFTHYDGKFYGSPADLESFAFDAGFLRPGEALEREDGTSIEHSTRPNGEGAGQGWPKLGESWFSLLTNHPMEIVVEADFEFVTPGLGSLRMQVRQYDFADISATGVRLPAS